MATACKIQNFLRASWFLGGCIFAISVFSTLWPNNRTSSLTYLDVDHTPQDVALSGSASALPGRFEGMLSNPASLSLPYFTRQQEPVSAYFSSKPLFFNEFRNNVGFVRFPGFASLSAGVYFQMVSSDAISILDDVGDTIGSQTVSFFSGGIGASYRFAGKERFFVAGLNLKGYQSIIAQYSALGFVADLGGMYYFSIPRPQFLKYVSDMPDSTLSVVVKNMGTGAKYISETDPAPLSYDVSLRTGIYAFRNQQLDLYNAFHHYVIFDSMRYSAGFDYRLFSIISFRVGFAYNIRHFSGGADISASGGVGLRERKGDSFGYSLDYTLAQSPVEGSSHTFGGGITYYLPAPPVIVKRNPEQDLEIVSEAQRVVLDVKVKKGRVPATLSDLYLEMRTRGYPEPKLTAGRIIYVPELEQVLYMKDGDQKDKVYVVTLKDGSVLMGNLVKSDSQGITLLTSVGIIQVPAGNVARISSNEFDKLDDMAKLRVQFLVLEYKKRLGRFPVSLDELKEYSAKNGWIVPGTVQNKLIYAPATGEVSLEPMSNEPLKKENVLPEKKSMDITPINDKKVDVMPLKETPKAENKNPVKTVDKDKSSDQILPGAK